MTDIQTTCKSTKSVHKFGPQPSLNSPDIHSRTVLVHCTEVSVLEDQLFLVKLHYIIEVPLELNLLGEKGEKRKTGNCGT